MTIQTETALKALFETGDVPTQANFADLIESALAPELFQLALSAGNYVGTNSAPVTANLSGAGLVADRIFLYPWVPRVSFTCDQAAISCSTAAASAQTRILIYSATTAGIPNALIYESADLDMSTTGNKTASVSSLAIVKGQPLWVGVKNSSSSVAAHAWAIGSTPDIDVGIMTGNRKVTIANHTYATAAPATWTWNTANHASTPCPAIWLRAA